MYRRPRYESRAPRVPPGFRCAAHVFAGSRTVRPASFHHRFRSSCSDSRRHKTRRCLTVDGNLFTRSLFPSPSLSGVTNCALHCNVQSLQYNSAYSTVRSYGCISVLPLDPFNAHVWTSTCNTKGLWGTERYCGKFSAQVPQADYSGESTGINGYSSPPGVLWWGQYKSTIFCPNTLLTTQLRIAFRFGF